MSESILITGGAGYIGSHASLLIAERGKRAVVYDNFSRGNRDAFDKILEKRSLDIDIIEGELSDTVKLSNVIRSNKIKTVFHFAALAYVGESVREPERYYENNVAGSLSLLKAMRIAEARNLIFSSTCATYGDIKYGDVKADSENDSENIKISEDTPQLPISPYGASKLMTERIIKDYVACGMLSAIIFRYFNAAGAHSSGLIGEKHEPETHLIPLVIKAAALGNELQVFGTDYPTKDGSCVRDYVHVCDIASAHLAGYEYLTQNQCENSLIEEFNIGYGRGYSVLEIINLVENFTGKKVHWKDVGRRSGDAAYLVSDNTKIKQKLNWKPNHDSISEIIKSACNWHLVGF